MKGWVVMPLILVLGGARSGKSGYAQRVAQIAAERQGVRPIFIATATAGDAEMAERINRHRSDRTDAWRTLETPLALAETVAGLTAGDVAVIDCLTLWLSNTMAEAGDPDDATQALVTALRDCPAQIWAVSNEVGWGIVPDNALARAFRDAAGRLHQALAAVSDETVLVVAGLALPLKALGAAPTNLSR